jgi:5-methyltetrahydrofolate--homocysteine methyltransferase
MNYRLIKQGEADMVDWEVLQHNLKEILLNGEKEQGVALSRATLLQGITPFDYFEKCIAPTLADIGKMFESLEIFLPELIISAEIVQQINDEVINPSINESKSNELISSGKVLLATVKGDLHDIGKNMVGLMLKVNGFEVVDLGINIEPMEIVIASEREKVDIIGMSSLLTTCLPYMKDVFDLLQAKKIRDRYSVIIGGAAPNADFAKKVGADGYGKSAAEAVAICSQIIANRN